MSTPVLRKSATAPGSLIEGNPVVSTAGSVHDPRPKPEKVPQVRPQQ